MNIQIGICDDDSKEIEYLKEIVEEYLLSRKIGGTIITFCSPKAMLEKDITLDLLFLDIEMPEQNGLVTAQDIRRKDREVRIVFLTYHREYIQKAFVVKAYRYLYKPYDKSDIYEVLNHVVREIITVPGTYFGKKGGERLWIRYCDIYYIEALGDGSVIILQDNNIITGKTLKYWRQCLPEDFMQCHKSFIVNMYYIKEITNTSIVLKDHKEIPLSIRRRTIMSNTYLEYIRSIAREI